MSGKHWGEIEKSSSEILPEIPDIKNDIEKAMEKCNLSDPLVVNMSGSITFPSPDPLVMYAISLQKYMREISEAIHSVKSHVQSTPDGVPQVPQIPEVLNKYQNNRINFLPERNTDFTQGIDVEVPVLNDEIVRKVLCKSICILLGQIGYESTHESLINILIDVVLEFYRIFCSKLRVSLYDEEKHNSSGFPNVMERVLCDLGMGGVKGLHDYYQARVIKYVNVLHRRSNKMRDLYCVLLTTKESSKHTALDELETVQVGEEDAKELHLREDDHIIIGSLGADYDLLDSFESGTIYPTEECTDESLNIITPNPSSDYCSTTAKRKKHNI